MSRPSPSDRHAESVERHINDLCQDRDWLRREHCRLQGELDKLRPEYERIREAYGNAIFNNYVSTACIALGGGLISAGGYFPDKKVEILWFGVAALVLGVLLLLVASIRGGLRRTAHSVMGSPSGSTPTSTPRS